MNVEYFKTEFVNFLRRFVAPINDQNVIPILTPLTYEEVIRATTEVINSQINSVFADSSENIKTPSVGIMVITPDAPDIPKINNEHGENGGNLARFRTLDEPAPGNFKDTPNEQVVTASPLPTKIDDTVDSADKNFPSDEKKEQVVVQKTSPSLVRSDTYVRGNNFGNASKDDQFGGTVLPQFPGNGLGTDDFSISNLNVPEFRAKLKILREVATEVVKKIDDLETNVPENTRAIRRLSTLGCFSGLSRNAVATRTIQRPKMGRRSLTAFPGTPTSSRMSPRGEKMNLSSMKSLSTVVLTNINSSRLTMPTTVRSVSSGSIEKKASPRSAQVSRLPTAKTMKSVSSTVRSVSSGTLKLTKKSFKSPNQGTHLCSTKSPALSLMSLPSEALDRPLKNPKYAHIPSTIPKPGTVLGKRKADEF
ncbi:uncharacterized protein [Venturia canescens]|nr:uncharacterized protein LOC122407894 isoform X2 [Venturia canescens]XP_043270303.1 uncharacterized protein LOC122407894 isoform X2 [Venturia canescens]